MDVGHPHFQLLEGQNGSAFSRPGHASAALQFNAASRISAVDLNIWAQDWIFSAGSAHHSPRTIQQKKDVIGKLLWFVRHRGFESCGLPELRQFFAYLANGHEEPGGRWGNARCTEPMRPVTAFTYYAYLKGFFSWMVKEEVLALTPFQKLDAPDFEEDQIQPFTLDQVTGLMQAAKKTKTALRDEAVIRFTFDTGVRASELCSLVVRDIDPSDGSVRIYGKGRKFRVVPYGSRTRRVIWRFLTTFPRDEAAPLFPSEYTHGRGLPLTRSGLQQIFTRLGESSGIRGVRCSPHTMRHTFALTYLERGGDVLELQKLLGHSSLKTTQRYVFRSNARLENSRRFSPGDLLA